MSDANYASSVELNRARKRYYLHSILSGVSFRFLAGNIITLYALRLGAGNTYIGVISSFMYSSLVFIIVGRLLVRRMGAVRSYSTFWAIRYACMIPAALTAFPIVRENIALSFTLLAIGVFSFHTARGMALAGQKTILGSIAGEKDRGAFLSKIQSLNTSFSTIAWLLLGFALRGDAPLETYAASFAVGIIIGLGAAWALSGIPEPKETESGSRRSLIEGLKRGFAYKGFRRLVTINLFRTLLLGMTGAFLIVYFRKVFLHPDSDVVYITLFGSFGVVAMAAIAGLVMDKVGAKPLFFGFAALTSVTLVVIVVFPPATSGLMYWLLPCIVIFLYNAGAMGTINCSQDYFFATVSPNDRLDFGIIYSAASGIGGFIGSVGGGLLLDGLLASSGLQAGTVYRLYFAGGCIAFAALCAYITKLPDIGAYSIRNTISILFSPRDLRAIRLLRRLSKPLTADEEKKTIRALSVNPSPLSVDELVPKLDSPSYSVRSETLNAFRSHPPEQAMHKALIREVTDHEYTTAHLAAEIIGMHRIRDGIPALRTALDSPDFMLAGKSMVALARLKDEQSRQSIALRFSNTSNPRLILFGARAFAVYGKHEFVPTLIAKLEPHFAPFMRDEIILAIAEISGLGEWFYAVYSQFVERPIAGAAELAAQLASGRQIVGRLALEVTGDSHIFSDTARAILQDAAVPYSNPAISRMLLESLSHERLMSLSRYRFLIAALLIHETFAVDS